MRRWGTRSMTSGPWGSWRGAGTCNPVQVGAYLLVRLGLGMALALGLGLGLGMGTGAGARAGQMQRPGDVHRDRLAQ
jgi:hypothetical protein